jgi:quercetin dioxygenase-like cupin family protein
VYEQIWDAPDVNAWVICWSGDQDTGFHDHDDSGAAIAVIEGHVREQRLGSAPDERLIGPGSTVFVPPSAIHRIGHAGGAPAVTIHAYSPPLRWVGTYQTGPGGEFRRDVQSYEQELRDELSVS